MTSRRPCRVLSAAYLAVAVLPLTAGCEAARDGRFDAQGATASPTCVAHQTQSPGNAYTAGAQADTAAVLEMMRFYTANGRKAFCDGRPATSTDRQWMNLYVSLGGTPDRVSDDS